MLPLILFSTKDPPKSKIYTRTGDKGTFIRCSYSLLYSLACLLAFKGTTLLHNGTRVPKTHCIPTTLGENDELTSHLGVALEFCRSHTSLADLCQQLVYIQCRIQELNSHIATPDKDSQKYRNPYDPEGQYVRQLELWIDKMDACIPLLKSFILPVIIWPPERLIFAVVGRSG